MGYVITLAMQQEAVDREAAYRAREERRALRAAAAAHAMSAGFAEKPAQPKRVLQRGADSGPAFVPYVHKSGVNETPGLVGWFRGTPVYNLGNPNSDHRTGAERRHTPTTGEGFSELPNRDKRGWESGNWATTREYTALASEKGLKKSRLVGGSTLADGNNGQFAAKLADGKLA